MGFILVILNDWDVYLHLNMWNVEMFVPRFVLRGIDYLRKYQLRGEWNVSLIVDIGVICHHLGYDYMKLLGWICSKIEDKFMCCNSQAWHFHVRLKMVQ